jgi:hypothetical protein
MKYHKHRPQVEFVLKMSFNMQVELKGRGHVLMTKFDKSEKIRQTGLAFRIVQFWQFQS